MADAITIDNRTGNGKYSDVLAVAETLARGDYGSASNALAVMCRQSPLFKATLAKLPKPKKESVPAAQGQSGPGDGTG